MCSPATLRANARLPIPRGVANRWDPHDVTLASPVTSSSSLRLFPFHWRRGAKAPGSPPLRCRGVPPRAAAASWPTMSPSAPATISSRAAAPRVLPTLAASGENPPMSIPPPEKEKRGRRRRGGGGVRGRPWERRSPRRPEPPVGGAGPTAVERACFLYFHVATSLSSSSSPTSRAALLH
jgi:hypothetical protein